MSDSTELKDVIAYIAKRTGGVFINKLHPLTFLAFHRIYGDTIYVLRCHTEICEFTIHPHLGAVCHDIEEAIYGDYFDIYAGHLSYSGPIYLSEPVKRLVDRVIPFASLKNWQLAFYVKHLLSLEPVEKAYDYWGHTIRRYALQEGFRLVEQDICY